MMTVLQDGHWKHVRNHLSPTFSGGKLRKVGLIGELFNILVSFVVYIAFFMALTWMLLFYANFPKCRWLILSNFI